MRIITCTENQSMLGNYEINYREEDRKINAYTYYCYGAEAAAAKAIELSISSDKYIIFGNTKVLDCIPKNLRAKS